MGAFFCLPDGSFQAVEVGVGLGLGGGCEKNQGEESRQ